LVAAAPLGQFPLARMARLSFEFKASMSFVVQTILRTSSGQAKNGMTSVHHRSQLWPIAG